MPFLCPKLGWTNKKIFTPVVVPEVISVRTKDGRVQRYRLSAFVHHHGGGANSGHYTAGRIVNGQKYFIDDQSMSIANDELWNQMLSKAYLLNYLPEGAIQHPAPVVPRALQGG